MDGWGTQPLRWVSVLVFLGFLVQHTCLLFFPWFLAFHLMSISCLNENTSCLADDVMSLICGLLNPRNSTAIASSLSAEMVCASRARCQFSNCPSCNKNSPAVKTATFHGVSVLSSRSGQRVCCQPYLWAKSFDLSFGPKTPGEFRFSQIHCLSLQKELSILVAVVIPPHTYCCWSRKAGHSIPSTHTWGTGLSLRETETEWKAILARTICSEPVGSPPGPEQLSKMCRKKVLFLGCRALQSCSAVCVYHGYAVPLPHVLRHVFRVRYAV